MPGWFGPQPKKSATSKETLVATLEEALETQAPPFPPSSPVPRPPEDVEDRVVDELYDWIETIWAPAPQFRGDQIHVTSLYNMCSRKVVFAECFPELNVKEPVKPHSKMTWDFGTATHSWWQDRYFGPMGWLWGAWRCSRCRFVAHSQFMPIDPCEICEWVSAGEHLAQQPCELSCRWPGGFEISDRDCRLCNRWGSWTYLEPRIHDKELGLVGSADGILKLPEQLESPDLILELKTVTKDQFDRLVRPSGSYLFQINTYMHFLGFYYGLILYVHKGEYDDKKGNKPRAFLVEYDPGLAKEGIQRIKDWKLAEQTKRLGKRICPAQSSWQAKRCPFNSVCYLEDIDDRVEALYAGRKDS